MLDVGAGTGIYSLNLAIRGAKITALDISQNMLNELENSAKFHQILGVKTLKADFAEFNTHEKGNEFDILTSFFSPAISQENVYGKLIKTPKIGLCLLSWAGKRESEILNDDERDELYEEAKSIILESGKTSISYLQRQLRIGYNRAANIIEQLEKTGFLSKADAKGQREIN